MANSRNLGHGNPIRKPFMPSVIYGEQRASGEVLVDLINGIRTHLLTVSTNDYLHLRKFIYASTINE
jgi:hypothetical protein|tara:strand:- start:218 stop:418 length:201 start_codon:yes stop_codon:yes gene_type:complete